MHKLVKTMRATAWTIVITLMPWSTAVSEEDPTQDYLTFPNFPDSDNLPVAKVARLNDGLRLEAGAVSKAALSFQPGGSTDTREKLDSQIYYNHIFGDQNAVVGVGVEGDTASTFTRPRRYPKRSSFNLLNFTSDGLNLGTICSRGNTPAGCRPGQVFGAMLRLPTVILPGDIVSVTMRTGASRFFYTGLALYAAVQKTPGSRGRAYEGTGAVYFNKCYGEISLNDDYSVPGVAVGHQLKMGVDANNSYADNIGGSCFKRAPHEVYDANGPNFAYHPNRGHPFFETRKSVTYKGMHTYTCWLTHDGSNLIHFFYDGLLVSTEYYEPALSSYVDRSGKVQPVGYSLAIASQTIPTFLNSDHNVTTGPYASIVPNDGKSTIDGPWSATIQSVNIIRGSITAGSLRASQVDVNGTDGETYNGLRDYKPG